MANVAHNTLTGADLHEPKGIVTAGANTVYVADGVGSGAWLSGGTLIGITGQIADFATPIAPTGWLECDGAAKSRSTFATLFNALSIQQTGTRTTSSAVITGLTSTTNMVAGYFVGGTGITNGTTILSVDSPTQITMSAVAGSNGSATVFVSPWALGDGSTTFNIPNTFTNARYRRSRTTSPTRIGLTQADGMTSHTHPVTGGSMSGTTSTASVNHTHSVSVSGTSDFESHNHTHTISGFSSGSAQSGGGQSVLTGRSGSETTSSVDGADRHTHFTTSTGVTASDGAAHTHTVSVTGSFNTDAQASGLTETRPLTLVVMTCIKT